MSSKLRVVKDTIWNVIKHTSAEPALLIYLIAGDLQVTTSLALWYQKSCLSLYDSNICDNIADNETLADEVQKVTSRWQFYSSLIYNIPALFTVFILGYLSDRYRRKIPIFVPFIGSFSESLIYLIGSIFMDSSPGYLLLGPFCSGLCGGFTTLLMGTVSYISQIAGTEKKTFRISILYGCSYVASFITYLISGIMYENIGSVAIFAICASLALTGFLYSVFIIKEISTKREKSENEDSQDIKEKEESKDITFQAKALGVIETFYNKIKEIVLVPFKRREYNSRAHILVLCGVIIGDVLGSASGKIGYLYLKHPPLSYSQVTYGYYRANSALTAIVCLFVIIPLFKTFKVKDTKLLLAALLCNMAQQLLLAFSSQTWMPFVISWIGLVSGGTFVCIRGLLSLMVLVDELGKIFALMAVLENLSSLASSGLYSYFLYPLTVDIFPSFSLIIGGIILVVPLICVFWLQIDLKSQSAKNQLYDDVNDLTLRVNEENVHGTDGNIGDSTGHNDMSIANRNEEHSQTNGKVLSTDHKTNEIIKY